MSDPIDNPIKRARYVIPHRAKPSINSYIAGYDDKPRGGANE